MKSILKAEILDFPHSEQEGAVETPAWATRLSVTSSDSFICGQRKGRVECGGECSALVMEVLGFGLKWCC